ncbi:protein phosphatase CheZ [Propionivibrio sp.]|uniref:protein phosphatase CheZ n=1 Tax=Propionivibrio sp. TaxID=2212460 RepID=UPI0025F236FA|nr:protein phosphatase CheZ [Propionivibrio sp.]MBK7355517.1 protein phosphatase CheZ [Propionivibrio sp.]MBK8400814.1 protein phosphatase CheZ [Propionivibrio sp.]MBK8744840.1 protein phosphatase CheZ [Propionivibrio sp.]MBK8893180.1 protein phosphatase CheZ [Propionivibrio sp.]MBL0207844.1 protein phosphatase CheZ [Propionivibrio sp.]
MSDANSSGDSSELEALFDSIAGGVVGSASTQAPAPAPAAATKPSLMQQVREVDSATDDSKELQALFDSIAAKRPAPSAGAAGSDDGSTTESGDWPVQGKVFNQVGQMARQLHDTLGSLGYEKLIEKTASALPDAKDRLAYIANLTEQAACKVLNATDIANPLLEELEAGAALLGTKWDALFANNMGTEDFKLLAAETRAYLKNAVPQRTAATKEQLMEIMMAQDFQDLTGQVIKKVVAVAQDLEAQLMNVLVETMPGEKRTESVETLLNGPVINAEGRTDVVGSQQQVDSLLDSLGF